MVKAIEIARAGGPEVLKTVDKTLPNLAAGQVLLRHTAIGLNYIDTYHRTGLYPVPLPAILGMEASGVIEALGDGVTQLKAGDRVAYGRGPIGAYAERRIIRASECVKLPENISDELAAAGLLKALTAWYLLTQTFPVKKGDTILVHAAAGGVGQLLSQWGNRLGARVIGTAGNDEKALRALKAGCHEVIVYRHENVAERVQQLTHGQGVEVVYDAVGKDTFMASLNCLRPLGMMVSYGQASGPIPPLDVSELSKRGSLFLTRPTLMDYVREDKTYHQASNLVLGMLARGELTVEIGQRFSLWEAAKAHEALEARHTQGSTILVP